MSVKRYQPVAQCVEPSYQAQMIEPKVMEFSEGEYVRWEDYDATCETLAHTETERDAFDAEVQRLKAEVERLRKAGDAVVAEAYSMANKSDWPYTFDILAEEWNAAKEGEQS